MDKMKVIEKSWNEFWAKYWRIENRHKIPGIFEWDRKLVDFIEYVCDLRPPSRILDLGCGAGDQAKLFAKKGYVITGIDIAPSLIEFAKKQFIDEGLNGEFIAGDMREIDYDSDFDACLILSGTFGFFSNKENQILLNSVAKALTAGGKVFIMFLSSQRDKAHRRSWSKTDLGWELGETWYDSDTYRYCSRIIIIRRDGVIIKPSYESGYHANEAIRCYSVQELTGMFSKAGLKYLSSYSNHDLNIPPKGLLPVATHDIIMGKKI
ncbi:class I SAM-dependent methyltransferase [bacterium]|nr:class I SAM-dependent methyltransferase [bacterium]